MRVSRRAALLCAAVLLAPALAAGVSYQGERELGQRFDLATRQRAPLLDDADITAYVQGVGQRIAARLDPSFFDYRFAVVRDGRINAFAVPGGFIYLHSGLLAAVRNEDELAAVLGHEIAHVHGRHLVRQQEKTEALNYAALLGTLLTFVQPAVGSLATAASQAVALQYKREFEQEADYLGARYMREAGYDPRGMLDFFALLGQQQRVSPATAPPYLHTHPLTDERLDRLAAVLKTPAWQAHERPAPDRTLRRVQALVRARSEKPGDVQAAYRRARAAQPADAEAQYLYGIVALETGQLDEARAALAAARAGGIEEADRELGALALRERDAARARTLLTAHLDRRPRDAGALVDLARAEQALDDTDAALAAYHRALVAAPELDAAHHGYGLLSGRAGRAGEGFYHLAAAARLDGDYPTALSQYARAAPLLAAGDPRREDAERWVAILSDYLQVPKPE